MFKSAVFRLFAVYFSILLLICAFLSYNWYRVALREIDQVDTRLQRSEDTLRRRNSTNPGFLDEFVENRLEAIEESKAEVRSEIFLINAILLGLGGMGAYLLAKRTLEPIEASHEALERFTSDASHELRTPLASMQTEIETTLRSKSSNKKELENLATSNLEDVEHMSKLVDNLLTLTRDQTIPLDSFSAAEAANSAVKKTAASFFGKEITLKNEVSKAKVRANKQSTVQILTILLDNAAKYSPNKSEVVISGFARGNNYIFTVKDKGKGIEKENQAKVFERFYRDESARSSPGFGLGLSIAKKLADQQHSTLKLKTSSKDGSIFELCLPAA